MKLSRKTESLIDREAIAFYKPFPLRTLTTGSVLRYILEQITAADALMLALCALAVTLVGLLTPWLTNKLLSEVLAAGSIVRLGGVGVFLLCSVISSTIFSTIQALIAARTGTKLSLWVEAAAMMRLLSLPAEFFRDYAAGELSNRTQYLSTLAELLVGMAFSTGLTSVFSLLYIAQVFVYAPALLGPALAVTILTLVVTAAAILVQIRVTRQRMLLASKESGMSYALIAGIQKIRLAGAEKRAFARWGKLYAKTAALEYDPPVFLKISSVITIAITLLGTILMYFLAIRSSVSVSEYYAFNAAYGMVNGAFMSRGTSGIGASAACW